MTRYIVSPAARRDVEEHLTYAADYSLERAESIKAGLTTALSLLARRPNLGHRRNDLTELNFQFWTVKGRYMIVYRADLRPIEIVRVFGPGQDVGIQLK